MKNIDIKKIGRFLMIGIIGMILGWLIKPAGSSDALHSEDSHAQDQIWTCSMHPQIRQQEPGKCPICGMDLIPLSNTNDNSQTVVLSENAIRLANIQTIKVSPKNLAREISIFGKIKPDERRIHSQTSHISGRIEELLVNFTGESVRKNQVVAYIYSPDLVTTQEELIETYKIREEQPELYKAARERLINWKLTDKQIDNIIAKGTHIDRFPVQSDVNGIVLEKKVSNGDHVMTGEPLYEVANLSKVWALLEVYEKDLPWVKVGNEVIINVESIPGETFSGKISFIDPVINSSSRVANARVELNNSDLKLKPEMLLSGNIKSTLEQNEEGLVIPRSAVMWTGKRSIVYIKQASADGSSLFSLREIVLGPAVENGFVVKEGLDEGDEIAVNGTFAIDAAAQLEGKPSMMNPISKPVYHIPESEGAPVNIPNLSVNKQTKDIIFSLLADYLLLKDNLVLGDVAKSKEYLGNFKSKINEVPMGDFTGEVHDAWMSFTNKTIPMVDEMLAENEIEAIRLDFKPLSQQVIIIAEAFGPFETTLYVQHCPMADSYTGGDWLSTESEIRNPYFGDAMLTCGSVTKEISNE